MTATPQEIAFELTLQTGQVYTCPDGENILGPDRAYHVSKYWRDNTMLQISEMGPMEAHRSGDSIRCNSQRTAEAIARDIRNRLPDAAAHYAKTKRQHAEKVERENLFEENKIFFEKLGLRRWSNHSDEANLDINLTKALEISVKFRNYYPDRVVVTIKDVTPEQAARIIEFTKRI